MTSLTERLAGEGIRQDMEYEEELMHNALTIAQNSIISVAKKVEDSVLYMMIAPVFMPHHAAPQDPVANPLHTLVKAPNALVIK